MKCIITDKFFKRYRQLVRTEMIPFQWNVLNDSIDVAIERERNDDFIPNEKSHAIMNFKIAAGMCEGKHYGWVFQDSDVYKWLEAAAYSLMDDYDEELKKLADSVIDIIEKAQEDDGYLNTYFTIMAPDRKFKRLSESHELYCIGHYIEAAVAYYKASGSIKALNIAKKAANCVCDNFGIEEGKIRGYDGHEEIELALMKLFRVTGDEKYKSLARFFLDERGKDPDFFRKQNELTKECIIEGSFTVLDSYFQNHKPVLKQDTAEGHAVRLVYLCTAMADLASSDKDEQYLSACKKIWRNIVDKRMYITGGIGSTVLGEAFTLDYDLPNDVMYCETCASIGLIFFAKRMLMSDANGEYADIMERTLYNTVLAGMALDGRHFFYVNPLEVEPKKDKNNPTKSHVKAVRPEWLGCACCPPNLARLIASLEQYIYTFRDDEILINLYIASTVECEYKGSKLILVQDTEYPKNGKIKISVEYRKKESVRLGIRVPFFADKYSLFVNGKEINEQPDRGFIYLLVEDGDTIEFDIRLEIVKWYSNNNVSTNIGKVAIGRGPFIYCAEGVDNGDNLHLISVNKELRAEYVETDELGGIGRIVVKGKRRVNDTDSSLYVRNKENKFLDTEVKLIPYYSWANRGENEMRVWIDEV